VLNYPRRVYTHLFPAAHTWWLLLALLVLTIIDWVSFDVLNMNNDAVSSMPKSVWEAVAFFQSISNRSAGFSVIPIAPLAMGTQVLCLVMMYISAYPVLIPLRSSNVYEELSLGIYERDLRSTEEPENQPLINGKNRFNRLTKGKKLYFLREQIKNQ
jgi:Trk-type K+ transport system membrane component